MTTARQDHPRDRTSTPTELSPARCLPRTDRRHVPRPRRRHATPITICRGCPVQAPCLEYALANVERFGIFGGCTERQRRRLRSQRRQANTTEERSA